MSTPDDLPWPELGNVSRGATRGNQGQKGVLGPADREGRCILQLRVQPGVLAVRLNRLASDWYRTLDNEVNRALKLTKTYWRKARRRQDYDARADQDHMELHEWLQQLKDKTMAHLELLMQKGDIQGPPYAMPDDIELTFLRKFIERQAAGIPHNPRLRNSENGQFIYTQREHESFSPEPPDQGFIDQNHRGIVNSDHISDDSHLSQMSSSPSLFSPEALAAEASSSKQTLQASRMSLLRAQKDTQDAFMRYTSCLDTERQARKAVAAAEKRRDDIMTVLLARSQMSNGTRSRKSSVSGDDHHSPGRYPIEDLRNQTVDPFMNSRMTQKPMDWPTADDQSLYTSDTAVHLEDARNRKHSRTWDQAGQSLQDPYGCEVARMPPHIFNEYRTNIPDDRTCQVFLRGSVFII
ncbi:hypothetical protein K443DRAFT_270975 [Laccaria amethystina LaAM-08-1]|uniref:Unplaced genomic scaffold K443scaffold_173, whole genome shotgun sequence n=1 Tax=Laccaria amethystina LaAM-08-1 TaxID=1095629 RepID=A0A0C9XL39_9AGAR|nr:hypothetical protein K443DRAFT_270975 [Laccaria amethystina LaAM-08-1]